MRVGDINAKTDPRIAAREYELAHDYYTYYFAGLQMGMFDWHNMGKFFDAQFAENELFWRGWVTVWYDPIVKSYLCGQVIPQQRQNIYGGYTYWRVQCVNGYTAELSTANAVIIYNSKLRRGISSFANPMPISTHAMLRTIIDEMTLIHQTMMVNINSMGCPLIISGTQQQRLTLSNKVAAYDSRVPYIFVDVDQTKGNDGDIKALKTEVTAQLSPLAEEMEKCRCEGLTLMGLDNFNVYKKERMLVDEVNANNQQCSLQAQIALDCRNDGLQKLNDMYGTECYVDLVSANMMISDNAAYQSNPSMSDNVPDTPDLPDISEGGDSNG